jgi:hypothetical protein
MKEQPMPRNRHRQPRPAVHTVLGGFIAGITRTLLDWILHHFAH